MNIGVFALAVAAVLAPIVVIGELCGATHEPPKREEKTIRYPFPEELP